MAPHAEPRYLILTDREAQSSSVMALFKHPAPDMRCPQDYLEHCRRTVFHTALNSRFFKLSRKPDPPFFAASVRACDPWAELQLRLLTRRGWAELVRQSALGTLCPSNICFPVLTRTNV